MAGTRRERVEQLIVREVSDILRREVKDPRIGFVTVTDAEITPDLGYAKIFVSVLGTAEEQEAALKGLNSATRFIRSAFGKRVTMRTLPEFTFRIDTAIAHGARIHELLEQVKRDEIEAHGEEAAAESGEGDSSGA
jgi:ribosome-binding factor A